MLYCRIYLFKYHTYFCHIYEWHMLCTSTHGVRSCMFVVQFDVHDAMCTNTVTPAIYSVLQTSRNIRERIFHTWQNSSRSRFQSWQHLEAKYSFRFCDYISFLLLERFHWHTAKPWPKFIYKKSLSIIRFKGYKDLYKYWHLIS